MKAREQFGNQLGIQLRDHLYKQHYWEQLGWQLVDWLRYRLNDNFRDRIVGQLRSQLVFELRDLNGVDDEG